MIKKISLKSITQTATFQQSSLAITSTIINGLLGVAFYPLVARLTGVADFGVFSISILAMTLLADVANFGTDTGIVRFVGKHIQNEQAQAYRFLKFALKLKIVIALIVSGFGFFAAPFIATQILKSSDYIEPLRIAFIGSGFALLYTFTTSSIQSIQKFGTWSVLNISMNALRLIAVGVIALLGYFSTINGLLVYIFIPFVGFITGFLLLPNFWKVKNEDSVASEFLHYNKWIAAFILIAAISSRLDSFLTARFLSAESVGIYAAAVTLATVGTQIVSAIATVVAPKLASFNTKQQLYAYLKKLQLFLLALGAFLLIAGSLSSIVLIPLLFGEGFVASIKPFIILLVAQIIFLISIPVHTTIIYYYAKPVVFVGVGLMHLVLIYFLGTSLIQTHQYVGAAITVLVGNISNLLLPTIWMYFKSRHEDN